MTCHKCTNVPKYDYKDVRVYMTTEVDHLQPKMIKVLKMLKYEYSTSGEHLIAMIPSFELFLDELWEGSFFNSLETRELMLLPLETHENMSFDLFNRTRNLYYWLELSRQKEFLEVLRTQKIKTLFQPIVRVSNLEVFGHEALSRGIRQDGRLMSATTLFESAKSLNLLFNLDRQCREASVYAAAAKDLQGHLFMNFIPTAIYDPKECLKTTDEAIKASHLKVNKVVFEVVESEKVESHSHLRKILNYYKEQGYKTALDDVGTGFSTIEAYHALDTNFIKIAMDIVRNIDHDPANQAYLDKILHLKYNNGVAVIAEGVEREEELNYLKSKGVDFVQGYYFGKPE